MNVQQLTFAAMGGAGPKGVDWPAYACSVCHGRHTVAVLEEMPLDTMTVCYDAARRVVGRLREGEFVCLDCLFGGPEEGRVG